MKTYSVMDMYRVEIKHIEAENIVDALVIAFARACGTQAMQRASFTHFPNGMWFGDDNVLFASVNPGDLLEPISLPDEI